MLYVLDLFAGIGGFSLGLERTGGFRTVAFCEISRYCRAVLARHWPAVRQYADIRRLTAARLARDGIDCDVLTGGFPCQDISVAGRGAGLAGARSGLWREYARLIGELRPQYALVENVPALLTRGLGEILGDLVEIGYDAEWHCIPAAHLGAPHRRDRVWIIAYPSGAAVRDRQQWTAPGWNELQAGRQAQSGDHGAPEPMADADSAGCLREREQEYSHEQGASGGFADGRSAGRRRHGSWRLAQTKELADADLARLERWDSGELPQRAGQRALGTRDTRSWSTQWLTEPRVCRVANGVPARVDRLRALGNAIVPQLAEFLGYAILAHAQKKAPEGGSGA